MKDKIYIDLCDPEWRVVEIDKHGWSVLSRSPVLFIRKKSMSALPIPAEGGDINNIW